MAELTAPATFRLSSAGIDGSVAVKVTLNVPNIDVTGTFALALNTTPTAALGLPAGPYLRVEASNAALTVMGQSLGGSFAFEKAGDTTRLTITGGFLNARRRRRLSGRDQRRRSPSAPPASPVT